MPVHASAPVLFNRISRSGNLACVNVSVNNTTRKHLATTITGLFAAAFAIASGAGAIEEAHTLSNIPQELSGKCTAAKDCSKLKIQRPKSGKAESCTIKCVTTCNWGHEGSPVEALSMSEDSRFPLLSGWNLEQERTITSELFLPLICSICLSLAYFA